MTLLSQMSQIETRNSSNPQMKATMMIRQPLRGAWMAALLAVAANGIVGCIGEKGVAPALSPAASTLGAGSVSPMNAILAVGETLSVTMHAKSLAGDPVTSFDSVAYVFYQPTDSVYVSVSPAGVVTGRRATGFRNPVRLGVLAFKNGGILTDVALLQVTPTGFSGATLSIQPIPPDSARVAAGFPIDIYPVVMNASGDSVVDGAIARLEFGARDTSGMSCYQPQLNRLPNYSLSILRKSSCESDDPALLNGVSPDTVWVHANVLAYGVWLRDSVQYTITYPIFSTVAFVPQTALAAATATNPVAPLTVRIAPGGVVQFENDYPDGYGTSVDITFDQPGAATATTPPDSTGGVSGNIVGLKYGYNQAQRQFLTAGTYGYTYTFTKGAAPFNGQTGRGKVIVQ